MKRNLLLLFLVIIISIVLSHLFSNWLVYNLIFNYYGDWIVPKFISDFVNGFPFAYLFVSPLLFVAFSKGKKWIWTGVSVLPIVYFLFYIEVGKQIWMWAVAFFAVGILIGYVLKLLILKIRTKNTGSVMSQ